MDNNKELRIYMIFITLLGILMMFAAIFLLPSLVDFSKSTYTEISYLAQPVASIVSISAVPFFIVLFEAFSLCSLIIKNEIFTKKPLKALNIIAICACVIFFLFIIIMVLFLKNDYFTPLLAIILFLVLLSSFIIGLFSKIMYILVEKATILKEDNDLTI